MNLVTRGLGANGVLPTSGLGFDSFGLVVPLQPRGFGGVGRVDEADILRMMDFLHAEDDLALILAIIGIV